MQQKKIEEKQLATYIRKTEDPISIAQDRVEALPDFINFIFDLLKKFCQTFDQEFNEFNRKLHELQLAKSEINFIKGIINLTDDEKANAEADRNRIALSRIKNATNAIKMIKQNSIRGLTENDFQ